MTPENNENKINDLKKKIIISMCAIVLLVLTIFGITYAYFTVKIQGNKENTSIEVSAALLKLDYNGENSYIEIKGLLPGESINSKLFSVKNTGTATIENYDVILENVLNELNRYEDLTYELTCISSDNKECKGNSGIFPKMNQVITTNTIAPGVKHSYNLTLSYKDSYTNQSVDMNKEISAKVNIKDDYTDINKFKIYGNYSIVDSSTNDSVKNITYLGNFDENTGKYKIPVKATGKNYLNIEHLSNISNWDTAKTYGTYEITLPKGEYTFNFETDLETYNGHILILSKNKASSVNPIKTIINGSYNIQNKQGTFTIDNNEKIYLNWYCGTKNQSNLTKLINDILNNFIIEDGNTFTGYEPYKESLVTNIYLKEPLRKLDDVADYIDLENKIVVRKVSEKIFDGTENIHTYEDGVYFGLIHNNNVPAISNYYSNNIEDSIHFTSTKNSNAIHFRVNETSEEFKNLIKERYNNNEPLKVLYVLNELTYEPINVPDFVINSSNTITVCDDNSLCASKIEVEFDE